MVAIFLALILICISLYSFVKCQYFYWFIMMFTVLPNYFAIEISDNIPLITANRILILFLVIYSFVNRNKIKPQSFKFRKIHIFLIIYFGLRLISNAYYIFQLSSSIKNILEILIEELLIIIIFEIVPYGRKEIDLFIKCLVHTASLIFILAIIETYSGVSLGDFLYTVQRSLPHEHYIRLGLLRATVTFGMPGVLAVYCIMMIPFIMYLYERTSKWWYLIAMFLDFLCILYANSRADIIILFVVLVICVSMKPKNIRKDYLRIFGIQIVIFLAIVIISCVVSSSLRYFYLGTAKSVLNEVGFDFDLNEGAPEGVEGYGTNIEGTYSRTAQFSGIYYAAKKNFLFGLGAEAQNRGEVYYYYNGAWRQSNTYDVAYVAVFMDEGILGLTAYFILFIGLFYTGIKIIKTENGTVSLGKTMLQAFIAYLLCMFATNNEFRLLWAILVIFLLLDKDSSNNKDMSIGNGVGYEKGILGR